VQVKVPPINHSHCSSRCKHPDHRWDRDGD
jgi:hypothetical protein